MRLTLEQYATISNYSFASATVVLSLACLTYLAQWAFARTVETPALADQPASVGAHDGAEAADERETAAQAEEQVTRYDVARSIAGSLTGVAWGIILVSVVSRGVAAERAQGGSEYGVARGR